MVHENDVSRFCRRTAVVTEADDRSEMMNEEWNQHVEWMERKGLTVGESETRTHRIGECD
jgi:hypothetical protein